MHKHTLTPVLAVSRGLLNHTPDTRNIPTEQITKSGWIPSHIFCCTQIFYIPPLVIDHYSVDHVVTSIRRSLITRKIQHNYVIVHSTKKERQKHCGNNVFLGLIFWHWVSRPSAKLSGTERVLGKRTLRNPNASHFERTCGSDGSMKSDFYADIFKCIVPLRHFRL